ncbi:MAG: ASCH domain-containing protein [Firmicutes bacterium]|nr:ASCH domain-containing protein [Bacillota bacterium]
MWDHFVQKEKITGHYEAWRFGGAPDKLAELVLAGTKTATASAYPLYVQEGQMLPQEGSYSVILNTRDEAVCIIRTTKVYSRPFREVSAEHAYKEGEGDRSLNYWRQIHREFFTQEMNADGLTFDEDMPVVCEEFLRVYP